MDVSMSFRSDGKGGEDPEIASVESCLNAVKSIIYLPIFFQLDNCPFTPAEDTHLSSGEGKIESPGLGDTTHS